MLYASVCPVLLTYIVKPSNLVSLHASIKRAPTVPATCAVLKQHKGTLISQATLFFVRNQRYAFLKKLCHSCEKSCSFDSSVCISKLGDHIDSLIDAHGRS